MTSAQSTSARARRVVASSLWSAWADALGFISELTDESGLRRRLRGGELKAPVSWTRRVGGRFGANVELPAGCYSDDTQLRIAVSRSVASDGTFDCEAFARVELPVWPAYALGGGHSSKNAAYNLSKDSVPWFANFYKGWTEAGGNGAAMRIQPHVWSHADERLDEAVRDVLVDATITHGHPIALLGALLHALALNRTLATGSTPKFVEVNDFIDQAANYLTIIDSHSELSTYWRPTWERTTQTDLGSAWNDTLQTCRRWTADLESVTARLRKARSSSAREACKEVYEEVLETLDLRNPATRGSGVATVLAALVLADGFDDDPEGAAVVSSSAINTDTDTIATMAAGLIGASSSAPSPPNVLDGQYITEEALRLASIAEGAHSAPAFRYPDLLHWSAPKAQIDAVGIAEDRPALSGLGWLTPIREELYEGQNAVWQWMQLDFGPSVLVKRRTKLRVLPSASWPAPQPDRSSEPAPPTDGTEKRTRASQSSRPPSSTRDREIEPAGETETAREGSRPTIRYDVDGILDWAMRNGLGDVEIGYAIRRISQDGTLEQLIAFTSTIRAELRNTARDHLLRQPEAQFERVVRSIVSDYAPGDWSRNESSDGGVDAIMRFRDGALGVVQVKRYKRPVGAAEIRGLVAALEEKHAAVGFLFTTSTFTNTAQSIASEDRRIRLVDGNEIDGYLSRQSIAP